MIPITVGHRTSVPCRSVVVPSLRAATLALGIWSSLAPTASAQLFVPNAGNDSVTVHDFSAQGNAPPLRTLAGPATALNTPFAVAADTLNEELFVSSFAGRITVYALAAAGDATPLRTLEGAATQLSGPIGLALDTFHDELYVRNLGDNKILVFARSAAGNTAPLRSLGGPATGMSGSATDLYLDLTHDELVIANRVNPGASAAILVFPRTASGNTAPSRQISGASTGLVAETYGVVVDEANGEILVISGPSVRVFPRTASGDMPPTRVIEGPGSGLDAAPTGIDLNLSRDEIFVAVQGGAALRVYARTALGNAAPLRSLQGALTGFNSPTLLGLDPRSIFADGFQSGNTGAWTSAVP